MIKEKKIRSFSYFRTLNFKNGIKEIFRDVQRGKSRKPSKRSSSHSAVQVMKFMIRFLSISYQLKSRRRSLSQGGSLDPGQVNSRRDSNLGKGYTQIIDKESKYAHTPQATTLKIILLMSQIHKWSLCVCVRCGLSVSQYADRWIKRIHSCSGTTRDSIPQSRPFGGSNVSYMVSEIHRDHGRFI